MTREDQIGSRVAHLKGLRAQLLELQTQTEALGKEPNLCPGEGRHIAIANTALEDAIMRFGKTLEAIGKAIPGLVRDPYPTSRDPGSPGIDPTAPEVRRNSDHYSPRPG